MRERGQDRRRADDAIALGMLDQRELRTKIAGLQEELADPADLAAIDVAMALLGDASHLRKEHVRRWRGSQPAVEAPLEILY